MAKRFMPFMHCCLQAFRDNYRIQFTSPEFAENLWQAAGLRQLFEGRLGDAGGVAVGLNPNIRWAALGSRSGALLFCQVHY